MFLIGRIMFGGFFIYSGIGHFLRIGTLAGFAGAKGVPLPEAAVVVTGLLLLAGGLSILLGTYTSIGLTCLLIFLAPVTLWMHTFWSDTDPNMKMMSSVFFARNVALMGAILMMFIIRTPWPWDIMNRKEVFRRL